MAAPFPRRSLTTESWSDLYDFLDPARPGKRGQDRDAEAEMRLAEITRKLVFFFASRSCSEAEDLATETALRVAAKCAELSSIGQDERAAYFYGVARNVLHEWLREGRREWSARESAAQDPTVVKLRDEPGERGVEEEHRCLDRCMGTLTRQARRLILNYYGAEKSAKIARHRELAAEFGKSVNALRIEVHRIRNTLRRCVFDCVREAEAVGA